MAKLHFIISLLVVTLLLSACDKKEPADQPAQAQDKTQATKQQTPPVASNPDTQNMSEEEAEEVEAEKEFANRKIYSELNADILKTIDDDHLEQAILDYVLLQIDKNPEKAYENVTALAEGFVTVFATMEVEGEVNNGGFDQYFSNTAGEFALEAIEGFNKIGAKTFAKITQQALDLSLKEMAKMAEIAKPGSPSKSAQKQDDASDSMEKLDNQFFDAKEDISELRIKYIRKHPDKFNAKSVDPSSDKKPPR